MYALQIFGALTWLLFVIMLLYRKRLINCQIFRDCFSVLIALQGMIANLRDSVSRRYNKNPLLASWGVWDMHARIMQSFILFLPVTQPLLKSRATTKYFFAAINNYNYDNSHGTLKNRNMQTKQIKIYHSQSGKHDFLTRLKRTVCLDDWKQ